MKFDTADIFFAVLIAVFFACSVILSLARAALNRFSEASGISEEERTESGLEMKLFIKGVSVAFICSILIYALYHIALQKGLTSHISEWLNLIIRWAHVVLGIAWIGASFYFIFLENSLNRTENLRDELAGNLWAIHGGGFYYVEKYKTAPQSIPKHLHWFKYEAYFTWLSGFSLLFIVYYFNAKGFLIDTNVFDMSPLAAIVTGIGSFVVAWLLYDILCRTALSRKKILFAIIGC